MTIEAEAFSTYVRIVGEAPFVLFHISVLACVLREIRRKNLAFNTGFYWIYVYQSCQDLLAYTTVGTQREERARIRPLQFPVNAFEGHQACTTLVILPYSSRIRISLAKHLLSPSENRSILERRCRVAHLRHRNRIAHILLALPNRRSFRGGDQPLRDDRNADELLEIGMILRF